MNTRHALPFAALLALLPAARTARADEPAPAPAAPSDPTAKSDPSELTLVTERVVVFKDGHALFVKRGTATADATGHVTTAAVPAGAILGCFWATSPSGKVLGMKASWQERTSVRVRHEPCRDVADLLRANVGHEVVLGLQRENAADVIGKIVEVLAAPVPPPAPRRADTPPRGPAGETVRPLDATGPVSVVIDAGGRRLVLASSEVRTVAAAALVTTLDRHDEVTTRAKRLDVAFGADAAGKPVEVRLFHFGEGVRWIPTYRVGGDLVSEAAIDLQGEVVNEAEPIVGAALDLVVGVPSFRFADVASPLSLEQTLRRTLAEAAPQLMSQRISNNFMSNSAGESDDAGGTGPLGAAPELATESAQDLFVYRLGKATLGKGERASYPLWASKAPLRHVYTAEVKIARDASSGLSRLLRDSAGDEPTSASVTLVPVLHQLELSNGSSVPWTTGAALVLEAEMPIAQNLLRYTSMGAKTLLPLTVAVDLPAKYEEVEVGRTPNAATWSHYSFTLVKKKATLTLRSRRTEASRMSVSLRLGGKAETATGGGTITLDDLHAEDWSGNPTALNNRSDVHWDLELGAGVSVTLEVTFAYYVYVN